MARKRRKAHSHEFLTGYWLSHGGLCSIPQRVIAGPDYRAISHAARYILTVAVSQYAGDNNGAIILTHSVVNQWGLSSKDTLQRAIDQLISAGLIVLTRRGYSGISGQRQAAMYGLAWLPIDTIDQRGSDGGWLPEITGTHGPPRVDFSKIHNKQELYDPA